MKTIELPRLAMVNFSRTGRRLGPRIQHEPLLIRPDGNGNKPGPSGLINSVMPGVPAATRAFQQVLGLVWSRHAPIKAGFACLISLLTALFHPAPHPQTEDGGT